MLQWDWLTILAVIGAIFSVYVLWQSTLRRPPRSLDERMQEFAKKGVAMAKSDHQKTLDYSLASISVVDEILEKIHQQHKKSAIPERELSRIVLTWGGYIGSVLKLKFGGTWKSDSAESGHYTYPLCFRDREAVPVMWCLQRIRRGNQHNVAKKAEEYTAAIDKP